MKIDNVPSGLISSFSGTTGIDGIATPVKNSSAADPTVINQVQLLIDESIQSMVDQLANSLIERETLLQSLPLAIRSQAEEVLRQNMPNINTIPRGLSDMVKAQRTTAEQLGNMAKLLADVSAVLSQTPEKLSSPVVQILRTILPKMIGENQVNSEVLSSRVLVNVANSLLAGEADTDIVNLIQKSWNQSELADSAGPAELSSTILQQFSEDFSTDIPAAERQFVAKQDVAKMQQILADPPTILDTELVVVQNLIKACMQNIPLAVKQAASQLNLPELQNLWVLTQLHNAIDVADIPVKELLKAGQSLDELALIMKKSSIAVGEAFENQKTLFFMLPIYLGENQGCYPAFIHIFHQNKEENKNAGEYGKESWLRICLITENAGAVNLMFQLYNDNKLNLRVGFSDGAAAQLFDSYLPDIRKAFAELPLILSDVNISAMGEL